MANRNEFRAFVVEALRALGGSATVLEVTKQVWQVHEADLRHSGDLFYTWQYDIRWAAQYLRNNGYLKTVDRDRNHPWELTESGWQVDLMALASSAKKKRKASS
ncbi:hypothetical protein [Microcella pacifica]|uniref:hypothetical protein n=1 Tax=Microcella pacifica TaxID=2591847 RepID=UPI001AEF4AFF|nr:hypothetical protein [Microcella pacifica]